MNKITVLFPGGFKPLTGAHLALAERYATHPDVERVIMLIGPKDRDGITRDKTIEIFNLINRNPNIEIQPTAFNSPITAAYEYLFALPENESGRYAMAASKKGDDYVRTKDFIPNVNTYKMVGDKSRRKIPAGVNAMELNLDVDPITYKTGEPISASTIRAAIANRDYATFRASYPAQSDAEVKNIWQILTGVQESTFSKDWWRKQLQEDADAVIESMMFPKEKKRHSDKIRKLRNFLEKRRGREFVYDFGDFEKTVMGASLLEGVEAISMITEGGAAGHMAHPYDDHSLTFGDMKEIVARALGGRLNMEGIPATEKTDGQNIQVTWKNGQIGFARNKGTVINPMTTAELQAKFDNRGPISEAFGNAGEDLTEAFSRVPQDKLNEIFKNGRVFANMEIIYPATKNVIAYEIAVLQFHNLVEYDDVGNIVQTDATGGALIQRIVDEANIDLQKKDQSGNPIFGTAIYGTGFKIIPPQQIKLGRVDNFEDQEAAFFNEIDQLRNRYQLKDTNLVSDYHRAWWGDVVQSKAQELGYEIPDEILSALVNRWAFADKSANIAALKKQITNADFSAWVTEFDKKDFKTYYKQNMEPFESVFLRLGAVVLRNAENFLAINPSKSVQELKQDLADLIKELQTTQDINTIKKLEHELRRIQKLGGFDAIVPSEGVVFVYGGKTYKLTGAFAPVNQILGVLKYAR
jgi:hypothetical protein